MTRCWNNDRIGRPLYHREAPADWWVLRCDRDGCDVVTAPSRDQPDLESAHRAGWFIARLWGDRCPVCVVKGLIPDGVEPRFPEAVRP